MYQHFFGFFMFFIWGWDALAKAKEGLERKNIKYKEKPEATFHFTLGTAQSPISVFLVAGGSVCARGG